MSERDVSLFPGLLDLAAGGDVLAASDETFARKENLLTPGDDGWLTRRLGAHGHDWCEIRLGGPGRIRAVEVDTGDFAGNHPAFASLDARVQFEGDALSSLLDGDHGEWIEVVPQFPLSGRSRNIAIAVRDLEVATHVRLNIYPGGGVAYMRVYGQPMRVEVSGLVDLAAVDCGGQVVGCTDVPGEGQLIVQLGRPSVVQRAIVDPGNSGDFALDAICWPGAQPWSLMTTSDWTEILPWSELDPDAEASLAVSDSGPWTHVRVRTRPDGVPPGFRVFAEPIEWVAVTDDEGLVALNSVSEADAREALLHCCGSRRWAERMVKARPFPSRAAIYGAAVEAWWGLDTEDWLAAFDHHPKIGSDVQDLREHFGGTSGSDSTICELADAIDDYADRYDFAFLVSAPGPAEELLEVVKGRLGHERNHELRIAAGEQAKTTRRRLEGLEFS